VVGRSFAFLIALALYVTASAVADGRKVTQPPQDLVESLGLKPFYRKHVSAQGFPVLGSEKASDYGLLEAAYLIDRMLSGRDDIRQAMIRNRVRFVVMAPTEMTTAVPEHSDLTPPKYWDKRARGLGASRTRPVVSCGEENLLGYQGDPYVGENILIHEFSHAIHGMGLRTLDPEFDRRLRQCYAGAMEKGLWKGTYAATNAGEYWAEGVQSWFDCNQRRNAVHNDVNTREELFEYDPELARLIDSVFPEKTWRYQTPDRRAEKAHLKGYDPATAPRFAWDPELVKWYEEYEKMRMKPR
jgi:hypothetical protein